MYRKILVPLDGSPTAEVALPRALELAARSGGSLHVVTVAESPPNEGARHTAAARQGVSVDRTDLVRAAEAYLEDVGGRIAALRTDVEITGQVLPNGSVASVLLHEMTAEEVDLTVLTTHGRGPRRREWLGGVADGLIRQSPRPLLLLRPGPRDEGAGDHAQGAMPGNPLDGPAPAFEHIFVPLDGSLDAEGALDHARELARAEGARITLASVVPPPRGEAPPYPTFSETSDGSDRDEPLAAAEEALEATAESLREAGIHVEVDALRGSNPATTLLAAAERHGADLIAMTTRGRGGAPRLLLGRVVDKVVRGADLPVLLHRPRRRDEG